jgi:hypothetical protein
VKVLQEHNNVFSWVYCNMKVPILRGPNWSLLFHVSTNALNIVVGAILGKLDVNDTYIVYYINKNLFLLELNYMVTEKDFIEVINSFNKFRHYIIGYPVLLYIDHAAIKYLMNKHITNGRVTRWLFLLHEYDINILNKLGKDNIVADFLSILTSNENEPSIEYSFPNEHLFAVSTKSPWFTDIANYLVLGRIPHPLSPKERQNIIIQNWIFSWINDCLFYIRLYIIIKRCT